MSSQFSLKSAVYIMSLSCVVLCVTGYVYRFGKSYFGYQNELYRKLGWVTAHFEVPWRTTPQTFVSSVQVMLDEHRHSWDTLPQIATSTDRIDAAQLRQHPDYHFFVLRYLVMVTREYIEHVRKSNGGVDLRQIKRMIKLLDELEFDALDGEAKNRYFEVQGNLDELVIAISIELSRDDAGACFRAFQFSLVRQRFPNLSELELPNALAHVYFIRELEQLEEQLGYQWQYTRYDNRFLRSQEFGDRFRAALDQLPDLDWPVHSLHEHEEMASELRQQYLIPPMH